MFSMLTLPLMDSKDEEDIKNVETLTRRVMLAIDDAVPTIERYGMKERFAENEKK
jgi:hypothetical protein